MLNVLGRWRLNYPLSCAVGALLAVLFAPPLAWSQTGITSPTLADLYSLAWQRHPAYAAQAARQTQFAANSELAQSLIAGAPSASVGYRSDAVSSPGTRNGLREWELGVSAPLALGVRKRYAATTAQSEEKAYTADVLKAQWQLAGELREAYWTWQLTHIEHLLLDDEAARAAVLVADSTRRTQAGETPRADTLQAQSALGLARAQLAESLQKEAQALFALQHLTGAKPLAQVSESVLSRYRTEIQQSVPAAEHPWLLSLERQLAVAKSKLQAAQTVRGEAPTLGTGFSRETSNSSDAQTKVRVSLSFALGTNARFAPKVAEAGADAIEREVTLLRATEQLTQDVALAKTGLDHARQKVAATQARAAASTETAALFAKAFSLGELEMPARLRAEADRASAVLAMNRAVIEHAAAISKFNQLLGYLP